MFRLKIRLLINLKNMITLLLSLVLWGLIFWLLWWGLNAVGIPEPFHKVATVVLVVAAIVVVIGLLTGSVAPFPVLRGL